MHFDLIVIGAGHAGCEAAMAAANLGARVLIFTIKLEAIGRMSCNPSIGGPAKGHLAREIDALGGQMGWVADLSGIHYRMLNRAKGPAVWAPRAQNDRALYSRIMRSHLEETPNLRIIEANISALIVQDNTVRGVRSQLGREYHAPRVIIASGTFLNGIIHVGNVHYSGGRSGEPSSDELSGSLKDYGFRLGRFKTGTPPRVDLRSLDFRQLEEQAGDADPEGFSYYRDISLQNKVSCYITHTGPVTHEIIGRNLGLSALYSGMIEGIGPRYCPSIEDKIVKFPSRESHQVFIEPEGCDTHEAYVNGVSTSLPARVQEEILHSIPGLQNASVMRYAYAIEYDYISPEEILPTLETKKIKGLFLAGQINGSSGYEEAAAQGLLAGINAVLSLDGNSLVLSRSEAYAGVLIDDLVTCGTNEPYRMFTSRAEHRLLLRQDNADERLLPLGYKLGLVSEQRWQRFSKMLEIKQRELQSLQTEKCRVHPGLKEPVKYASLLKRPEISFQNLEQYGYQRPSDLNDDIARRLELEIKYEGYLKRASEELERHKSQEDMILPPDLDYLKIETIAWEAREKLAKIQPSTIAQAMRIPGVNYTDTTALLIWLRKQGVHK